MSESIRQAVGNAGPIDALVNNVGIGMAAPMCIPAGADAVALANTALFREKSA
jgi:NAD(P)-dependent dehydrogenase (short-subunit alcohol dehydrogenase family)